MNYEVTIRLAQGEEKTVNLAEGGQIPTGGMSLEAVVNRAFLNGWDDEKRYYVNNTAATRGTRLFGGEVVTATKKHDNGAYDSNYGVTVRLAQGEEKTVNLAEGGVVATGGTSLEAIVNRAFLNGWDDEKKYYVNDRLASKSTRLFGGEVITATKKHDNG